MKHITAIIQPEMLDPVREALIAAGIERITVSRCAGHGRDQGEPELYRGKELKPNLIPKTRIDIYVNDDFVKVTVDTIMTSGRTGNIGDGKIVVHPIEEIYRIRTGETGGEAI